MKGKSIYFLFFLALASIFTACEKDETEPTTLSDSVRVSAFTLSADTTILDNLNTVFFTIDLENGLIFNADSLPKGTNVSALAASITFEDAASAIITQKDTVDFDYVQSNKTKINFTSPVEMLVTSKSGKYTKKYTIQVNVHTVDADLLAWGGMSYSELPGTGTLKKQKTLKYKDVIYCFTQRGEQYQLAVAENPTENWEVNTITWNFTPDLHSLQASPEALYILDTEGNLYTSADGLSWNATGSTYTTLLGYWDNTLLTLSNINGTYCHDYYPRPEGYTPTPVASNFPISGMSDMLTYNSSWMTAPQGMIVGGRTANGTLTGAMWGYDGNRWAMLNNSVTPREGAVFFQYVTFLVDDNWVTTESTAWFIIGGQNDQSALRDVWVSSNYGVTWQKANRSMQLPGYIAPRAFASVIICDEPIENEAAHWMPLDLPQLPIGYAPQRMHSATAENLVPYIYMFSGLAKGGFTYDEVWRGIINRLKFEPIP